MIDSTFPDTYKDISTPALVETYRLGPERLGEAIDGLTADDLLIRTRPDKWSIQEIVLHLADAEVIGAARIRMTYAEPGSTLPGYDQETWTSSFRYRELERSEVQHALTLFSVLRSTTLHIFRQAAPRDWWKAATHPEWGEVNLRQLLELYADEASDGESPLLSRRPAQAPW